MQRLTDPLKKYIKNSDYKEYVNKTLELTSESINNMRESNPDLLYSRLENIDEEDILTYFELDKDTNPVVWAVLQISWRLLATTLIKLLAKNICLKPLKVSMKKHLKIILLIIKN